MFLTGPSCHAGLPCCVTSSSHTHVQLCVPMTKPKTLPGAKYQEESTIIHVLVQYIVKITYLI